MTDQTDTSSPSPATDLGLRLAVADDEDDFRALVRQVAAPLGWSVFEFENGRKLVSELGGDLSPTLIILDMVMPQLDGIEAVGWIASTPVRCPIILVTGKLPIYSEIASVLADAKGLDVVEVLYKPVSIDRLREMLDPQRWAADA